MVGTWLTKEELGYPERLIPFRLDVDGVTRQSADSSEMIHGIDSLIAHVSRYQTLRMGDLIFTGTPAGVGSIQIGQLLRGLYRRAKGIALAHQVSSKIPTLRIQRYPIHSLTHTQGT